MAYFFMAARDGLQKPFGPFKTANEAAAKREWLRSIGFQIGGIFEQ